MNKAVVRAWTLSLAWIAVIALESFGGSSQNTSHLLYPVLRFLFPGMTPARMSDIHYFIRKIGHFTGYCLLSVTLYRSWWTTFAAKIAPERLSWREMWRAWSGFAVVLALLGTVAVAGLDEFHQSLTPGRTGAVADVALDEMGGILAQMAIIAGSSVAGRRRRSRPEAEPVTSC